MRYYLYRIFLIRSLWYNGKDGSVEKMNILKPPKALFGNLTNIDNLKDELNNDKEIKNVMIENAIEEKLDVYHIEIEKAMMKNVKIIGGKLESNTFTDVEFQNCDFSNTSFEKSSFIRCEFNNCKLTGCGFIDNRIYNVGFLETNMAYTNFAEASLENVLFKNSILCNSSFQENKFKNLVLEEADLTRAQFFKTSLKGIDFSSSIIEGMSTSVEDIKGAMINQFQAVDLLYLLGVEVKESHI